MTAEYDPDLPAAKRRRLIFWAALRSVLVAAVLVVLYYVLPLDRPWDSDTAVRLLVGLLVFAGIVLWGIRFIAGSRYPGVRGAEALALIPPFFLLLGFAVWTVFECVSFTVGTFLNGAEAVRFQIYLSALFGAVCITLKLLLIRRFGATALPWSALACCMVVQVIPWIVFIPRFLNGLDSKSNLIVLPGERSASFADAEQ